MAALKASPVSGDDDRADSGRINNRALLEVPPDEYCIPFPVVCLSVCLTDSLDQCRAFRGFPVEISNSALSRQLAGLGGAPRSQTPPPKKTNTKRETITSPPQHRNFFQNTRNAHLKCTAGGFCASWSAEGGVGMRDRINYHLQQIITGEGAWKRNLRSMCGLAPLDFTLTGNQVQVGSRRTPSSVN